VQTFRYAVLLFPGFPMMAFSALVEPLRAANLLLGETRFSWAAVGLTHDPVAASNGFTITPDHAVSDAPVVDRVVLCSGGDAERITSKGASQWLRRNVRAGAQIGAVADAAFFLAREGLLDGYPRVAASCFDTGHGEACMQPANGPRSRAAEAARLEVTIVSTAIP